MDNEEVQRWIHDHPRSIHGTPEATITRCVQDIRERGVADAWMCASVIVDREQRLWRGSHGNHASPAFVSKEICRSVAAKLRMTPGLSLDQAIHHINELERNLHDQVPDLGWLFMEPDVRD